MFNPILNSFSYLDFSGDMLTGARMVVAPFRLFSGDQYTLAANPIQLLEDGLSVLVGDTGNMLQVTDDTGRTLFEPGLSGPPKNWSDLRHDDASRIPNFFPIPVISEGASDPQHYVGIGTAGATQMYDIVPAPSVPAHTPYDAAFTSGKLSSTFSIPGTPGVAERITAEKIGSAQKTISLAIPSNSESKCITWTVLAAEKHRWAELSDLAMVPSQTIKVHLENAGYRVVINNNGPATSANLRVTTGPQRTPVSVGKISIPGGDSSVEFELPTSSLTVTGQITGKNGWLIAPVTLTMNAVVFTSLGLDAIEYGHDQVNWTMYTGPFLYSDQGATTIYYRARDKDLNQGLTNSQSFKIDTQAPTATGTVSTTRGVKLTYAIADPVPGSGVAGVHTIVQGQNGPISGFTSSASGTLTLPTTCSAVEFWGEDVAGNEQTSHVKIADSVPPVFTAVPVIQTTHCTAAAGLVLGVTATDDCGVVSLTNNAPAKFPLGTTVVTWTAKDAAGNTTTSTQQVTTDLGDDPSCCPTGSKIIMGTPNNDTLTGTSGNDCIIGLGGQDVIKGLGGDDAISGGDGDDILWGGDGNDWISGGTGQDTIWGEAGADMCIGGDGDDIIHGGAGNDQLFGGQGQDKLWCEDGDDQADGGTGDDTIDGGSGNDYLKGGPDHDTLNGGGGNDQCVQDGQDTLTGTCHAVPG